VKVVVLIDLGALTFIGFYLYVRRKFDVTDNESVIFVVSMMFAGEGVLLKNEFLYSSLSDSPIHRFPTSSSLGNL